MENWVIEVEPRSTFGKGANRKLRARGMIPAVVYGGQGGAVPVSVNPKEISRILRSPAGMNTIFQLQVKGSGQSDNVMIKDYQLEPVEHSLLHTDFVRVAMDHALTVEVHVELVGNPVGVKQQGGMLDFVTRSVEVTCLPGDIPDSIVVDVSELAINGLVRAGDLPIPERVTLETEPDVVIAHVLPPKVEAAPEEAEAVPAEGAAEPELIRRGKPEEEGEEE